MELTKSLILILLAVSIAVIGQVCLKTGMNEVGKIEVNMVTNYLDVARIVAFKPMVWLGLFMYGLGAIVWLVVLSRVNLSFAYPMLSISYILIVIISIFRFGEPVTLSRIIGTILICLGVVFITRS